MIKRELVLKLLESLNNYVEKLRTFQHLSIKEIVSDFSTYWAVQHGLQVAIQHVTDVGAHILAGSGLDSPSDYKEIILSLGRHKIIPIDFANRIQGMAGFRNILVHHYLEVDEKILYQCLQEGLADFEEFIDHIHSFLEREGYLEKKGKE